jgi:hypothetical protein
MSSTTLKRLTVAFLLTALVWLATPPGLQAAPRPARGAALAATGSADAGIWGSFVHGFQQALEALGLPFGPAVASRPRSPSEGRRPAAADPEPATLAGKMGVAYDPNG